MKNSMVMLTIFIFFNDIHFYGKFVSKYENCLLKFKFGTQTTLNIQNLMVTFFSVLDLFCKYCPKNPFGILMLPD